VPETERSPLKLVGSDAKPSVRALVEYLTEIAAQQRPTLRKNLANLLVDLVEHTEDRRSSSRPSRSSSDSSRLNRNSRVPAL